VANIILNIVSERVHTYLSKIIFSFRIMYSGACILLYSGVTIVLCIGLSAPSQSNFIFHCLGVSQKYCIWPPLSVPVVVKQACLDTCFMVGITTTTN